MSHQEEPQEGDRGLFGDIIQGIQSGAKPLDAIVSAVGNDAGLQQKIDRYAAELKQKVSVETERTVYEQSHASTLHEMLRAIIEKAVEAVPIHPPTVLGGPVAAVLEKFQEKHSGAAGGADSGRGIAGFVHNEIDRQHLDAEIRKSALRAMERYMMEHKQWLMNVGVEALMQKLRDGKVTSTAKVAYVKPPALPLEEFNRAYPCPPDLIPPPTTTAVPQFAQPVAAPATAPAAAPTATTAAAAPAAQQPHLSAASLLGGLFK